MDTIPLYVPILLLRVTNFSLRTIIMDYSSPTAGFVSWV